MPTYGAGNKQRQALQLSEFEEIIKGAGTSLNCKFNIFQYVLCLTPKEMEPMTKPIRITNIIDPDSIVLSVIPTGTTVILHHAKERIRVNPKMHEFRAALTNVILLEVISTSEISLVAKPIKEIFTVYFPGSIGLMVYFPSKSATAPAIIVPFSSTTTLAIGTDSPVASSVMVPFNVPDWV